MTVNKILQQFKSDCESFINSLADPVLAGQFLERCHQLRFQRPFVTPPELRLPRRYVITFQGTLAQDIKHRRVFGNFAFVSQKYPIKIYFQREALLFAVYPAEDEFFSPQNQDGKPFSFVAKHADSSITLRGNVLFDGALNYVRKGSLDQESMFVFLFGMKPSGTPDDVFSVVRYVFEEGPKTMDQLQHRLGTLAVEKLFQDATRVSPTAILFDSGLALAEMPIRDRKIETLLIGHATLLEVLRKYLDFMLQYVKSISLLED